MKLRRKTGSLIELIPAVFILLFFIVFPLINLLGLATGTTSVYLLTHQAANVAITKSSLNDAFDSVADEANRIVSSGIGKFAKLSPVSGFRSCGSDLYIVATNYQDGSIKRFGPNTGVIGPVDPSEYIYELQVVGKYDVGPLVDMGRVPLLGSIPGLGTPARLTYVANRAVEHIECLGKGLEAGLLATAVPNPTFTASGTPPANPPSTSLDGWNYPGIYQTIAATGQKVVQEQVLIVQANNPNWTDTGVTVLPGQTVWIDYRADGLWQWNSNGIDRNADGDLWVPPSWGTDPTHNGYPFGAMLGKFSNGTTSVSPTGTPGMFLIGKQQLNLVPPGTGKLSLINNEQERSNSTTFSFDS